MPPKIQRQRTPVIWKSRHNLIPTATMKSCGVAKEDCRPAACELPDANLFDEAKFRFPHAGEFPYIPCP